MEFYDVIFPFIDYSTSSRNRKRIISSIEIGIGLALIALGIGTATCEVEDNLIQNKECQEEYYVE